jgi:hypothetical protein
VVTQVVYISKTVTVQGGYTTTNWTASHPLTQPTTLDAQAGGRVIFIAGDISPTVEGLRIKGGDAAGLGGASGYSADDRGGGMYVAAAAIITHNWVFSNTASGTLDDPANYACGGGVFLGDGATSLFGNTIFSNTANAGGGVCIEGDGAVLDGNIIRANTISGFENQGGGIYLYDSVATIQGNVIVSNTAGSGGGLSLNSSSLKLIGNIISYNGEEAWGGGVLCSASDVEIHENLISFNSGWVGGGVAMHDCVGTLGANTITVNTATRDGGGLDTYYDGYYGSSITLTNNIIASNEAARFGSGLSIRGSLACLLHNTIARNAGSGGVYVTNFGSSYSTVTITNAILVSHTVGISVAAGNIATLEGTLWGKGAWANGTDWDGVGTIITGTVNVWGDPAFVDPDAGDYHIGPVSAAIDNGVDAGVLEDIDGDPRPMGSGYDIGADEEVWWGWYLPLVRRE